MKNVLITGASSGIGKAVATRLHTEGYKVYGTSRKPEKATDLPFEMLQLDVTDQNSVQRCIEIFLEKEKQIDVLINNAGFAHLGFSEEVSEAEAQKQMNTNFWGYVRMSRAVLPQMRRQGGGTILQVSSLAGSIGVPMQVFYSASKHAVDGFSKSLRMEAANFGVHVVLLKPGFINTGMEESFMEIKEKEKAYDKLRTLIGNEIRSSIQSGDPVEKVADKVSKIIKKRNPKIYYSVGMSARLLPMLYTKFPGLFEWGSKKKFKLN